MHYITAVVVLCSLLGLVLSECPNGWVVFNGSCYLFSQQQANFLDAHRHCSLLNGHLVNIGTQLENNFIKSFLTAEKNHLHWIGLNDLTAENVWEWQDTVENASFTDWDRGQPEGGIKQNCVCMHYAYAYKWHDDDCAQIHNYICEKSQNEEVGIVG